MKRVTPSYVHARLFTGWREADAAGDEFERRLTWKQRHSTHCHTVWLLSRSGYAVQIVYDTGRAARWLL